MFVDLFVRLLIWLSPPATSLGMLQDVPKPSIPPAIASPFLEIGRFGCDVATCDDVGALLATNMANMGQFEVVQPGKCHGLMHFSQSKLWMANPNHQLVDDWYR